MACFADFNVSQGSVGTYAYICILPVSCETLISAKQAINNKLQASVATYLTCGGVINNQIKKCLLASVRVNSF